MPTRKPSTRKTSAKKSTKRTTLSSRPESGPVPPYGEAIRGAIARGDQREMKNVAASARKWISDTQSALEKLDGALQTSSKKK